MKRSASGITSKVDAKKRKNAKSSYHALDFYKKTYKGLPHEDRYIPSLSASAEWAAQHGTIIKKVLYPASYIHIAPSLVFPSVVYNDLMSGPASPVTRFFCEGSEEVGNYLQEHRLTPVGTSSAPVVKFHGGDLCAPGTWKGEKSGSFDLLVCLSASGFIPESCRHFLRQGGLLFVNDDFGDACLAKANPAQWAFIGALVPTKPDTCACDKDTRSTCELITDPDAVASAGLFCSKRKPHTPLSADQLLSNRGLSFSSRPAKAKQNAHAYLFQKL